jgi:hypothetical protein
MGRILRITKLNAVRCVLGIELNICAFQENAQGKPYADALLVPSTAMMQNVAQQIRRNHLSNFTEFIP